ncbi:putative MFS family arabinose efflux permease [Chitinophaga skermanii]|uniref:Putative MFS family arabinose efflux permease n=1 Tax=Chitinophaga skermanii TaxID=331697 RepID=A0A327Q5W7_9BACT|nr:MFS transporter [Chitinophaga skermanii]RAI99838.1 putative MFS family arabinose efflux permease [Chitinophaga skermanii]
MEAKKNRLFSRYQVYVIVLLAVLQFTIVLDFMVLSPLGAILMPTMHITPSQFGLVVSAYAISAGITGFLAAGYADKFDRKKMLLFFYVGFVVGTMLCALATSYHFLLIARIVTGMFGGVTGAIGFAIITDLFALEIRGRVMGLIQMAFGASQVLGMPIGLKLANAYNWHAPFTLLSVLGVLLGIALLGLKNMPPQAVTERNSNAFVHLKHTISKPQYLLGFAATTLMATGGFMLMPFGTAFNTHNLGISIDDVPMVYFITGLFTLVISPLTGRLSDKIGKYKMFVAGSVLSMILVFIYCNMTHSTLPVVIAISVVMFAGVSSRMIAASTLLSAVPTPQDRGAFMSINSSVQQISGGIAAALAGLIVSERPDHSLVNFDKLGYVICGTMIFTIFMMYKVNKMVQSKTQAAPVQVPNPEPVSVPAE